MKTASLFLLLIFCFTACKKDALIASKNEQKTPIKPDTIPDKAGFKIKLYKGNSDYDETMFLFDHRSSTNYCANEDAGYLVGFGQVSLASISHDGRDLAINRLPYKPGMSIGLDFHTKTNGEFYLALDYENKIPGDIAIWLQDTYLKDSIDVCTGSYTFNVIRADTNSFGNKRFRLIIKEQSQK
ncbi:MAG: hypothetical protein ACHQHN_01525 [Sphingobacteriales bacterium]